MDKRLRREELSDSIQENRGRIKRKGADKRVSPGDAGGQEKVKDIYHNFRQIGSTAEGSTEVVKNSCTCKKSRVGFWGTR